MNKIIFSNSIFQFCVAFYLGLWYSSIVPAMLASGAMSYHIAGWAGLLMFSVVSVNVYFGKTVPKSVLALTVLLTIGFYYLAIVYIFPWSILLISVLHGLLVGTVIMSALKLQTFKVNIPFWILGFLFSLVSHFFSFAHSYKDKVSSESFSTDFSFDLGLISLILLVSFTLIILILLQKQITEISETKTIQTNTHKPFQTIGYFITSALILLEVSLIFWSMVLQDKSQSWVYQLTFPMALFLLFFFRKYFAVLISKYSDIGWLFVSTLLITVTLGLFYTFDFTLLFIVFFSFFMAFSAQVSMHIFNLFLDSKKLAILLFFCAVMMGIGGLYIQNHIEFIQSINMPENVLHLSARQAWVKELASLSGLVMVATGIVFLNRRKWLGNNVDLE
jgi:hypothetical protein